MFVFDLLKKSVRLHHDYVFSHKTLIIFAFLITPIMAGALVHLFLERPLTAWLKRRMDNIKIKNEAAAAD